MAELKTKPNKINGKQKCKLKKRDNVGAETV